MAVGRFFRSLKGYLVAEQLKIRCPLVFCAKNQIRTKEGTKNHRLPNKKLRVFLIKCSLVARELTFIKIIIKKNNELLSYIIKPVAQRRNEKENSHQGIVESGQ
jgi:hypothetical protein